MAELELNKIIGMIMENPELVEKIKAMSKSSETSSTETSEIPSTTHQVKIAPSSHGRSKRTELLRALETFLSEERKKSLETMITIVDVLDSVKSERKET